MRKAKIMVVEDETIIAAEICKQLELFGYEVGPSVRSAEEAIERVENEQPNLILMDIVLKGEMDGIDAAERIHEKWGVPIVFLSAYGDDGVLERAKASQPFGYLKKPFRISDIQSTVEMALYKSKMEKERNVLVQELQNAIAEIKTLRGFIPICAGCKNIRDDEGYWHRIEVYIMDHTEAKFSHGLCPECLPKYFNNPD